MSLVPGLRLRHPRLAALLILSLATIAAFGPARAQTADQSTAGTDQAIAAPTPSIFPTPTASSRTCLFGCSNQLQACQNTCTSTINGTTVVPSMTTAGVTSSPTTCQTNCSSQMTACQRNCNMGP